MKKLAALTLAALLILSCSVALADQDPIVGAWYTDIQTRDASVPGNIVYTLVVLFIEPDGSISYSMVTTSGQGEALLPGRFASWTYSEGQYLVTNILSNDQFVAYLYGDILYTQFGLHTYTLFHRMQPSEADSSMIPESEIPENVH